MVKPVCVKTLMMMIWLCIFVSFAQTTAFLLSSGEEEKLGVSSVCERALFLSYCKYFRRYGPTSIPKNSKIGPETFLTNNYSRATRVPFLATA